MIPTSEVPLTALHRGEILAGEDLPLRYTAYSPCFRKEAGAAGKDTRGLIRLHQFEKVELVWLTRPEDSSAALETADGARGGAARTNSACRIASSRCAPATSASTRPRPTTSKSGCRGRTPTARSARARTAPTSRRGAARCASAATPARKPELVHTLNGSGLAIGRTLVAILENYQQADGSVRVPGALVPYTRFDRIG